MKSPVILPIKIANTLQLKKKKKCWSNPNRVKYKFDAIRQNEFGVPHIVLVFYIVVLGILKPHLAETTMKIQG